jgi:hypothetical protein
VASMDGSSSADGLFSSPSVASSAASAVSSRGVGRGGRGPGCGGRGGRGGRSSAPARGGAQPLAGGQQAGGLSQAVPPLRPADLARIQHGLCFYHFNFGEQPTTALPPAIGETSFPGASWRRSSRPAGPHHGPAFAQAFPGGHRSCLFGFSTFLDQLPKRPGLGWCCWAAYFLLGRQDFSPLFRRSEFQLAFSASCSPVSPLLEWIFCDTSDYLWIRPLNSWSTATRCTDFRAARWPLVGLPRPLLSAPQHAAG